MRWYAFVPFAVALSALLSHNCCSDAKATEILLPRLANVKLWKAVLSNDTEREGIQCRSFKHAQAWSGNDDEGRAVMTHSGK